MRALSLPAELSPKKPKKNYPLFAPARGRDTKGDTLATKHQLTLKVQITKRERRGGEGDGTTKTRRGGEEEGEIQRSQWVRE